MLLANENTEGSRRDAIRAAVLTPSNVMGKSDTVNKLLKQIQYDCITTVLRQSDEKLSESLLNLPMFTSKHANLSQTHRTNSRLGAVTRSGVIWKQFQRAKPKTPQ